MVVLGSGDGTSNNYTRLQFETNQIRLVNAVSATNYGEIYTTAVYRDPSAWYHVVVVINTTNATAANRAIIYINGVQATATIGTTFVSSSDTWINSANAQYISRQSYSPQDYLDGYLAEVNFIDGQALTPSSFGSTNSLTGVWQPARYTGSYGTNGFYLPFTDNSALTTSSNVGLGKDFSGNANYWVTNNISITAGATYDSMTDVPTLTSATAANFAVLNPLQYLAYSITNGNLNVSLSGAGSGGAGSTIAVSSGKWYFEVTPSAVSASDAFAIGIRNVTADAAAGGAWNGGVSGSYIYRSDGYKRNNGTSSAGYGASYTTSDVIGVALDLTAGTLVFYKNNTSQGTAYSSISGTFQFSIATDQSSGTTAGAANFGQRPFTYTPPTGFVALNTYNLPTSTIVKGNTVMDAILYTGDGTTSKAVTGLSFQPDLTYVKNRSAASDPTFSDTLRGITKVLYTDSTSAESTAPSFGYINSILSTGFNVNSGGGVEANFNKNGQNYVGWTWKAGQGTNTSNTNGSITSTVSVNASAGLSMVTYTGTGANATVGHGLGVAPQMVIIKGRGNADNWIVYNAYIATPTTHALILNSTIAPDNDPTYFNSTAPTSSVFSVGTDGSTNQNTIGFVAYCWTPIAGYSAFGSYTGNGSADGPFVYTGFRPKYIMMKDISAAGSWIIQDSVRNPYNPSDTFLQANTSSADYTYSGANIDFVANGFKIRGTDGDRNFNGYTYIYIAFAENPLKNALAR
jgi:hypothetical protein